MKRAIALATMVTSLLGVGAVVAADGDLEPGAICCDKSRGDCPALYPLCYNSGVDCDREMDRPGIQGYCVKDNDTQ